MPDPPGLFDEVLARGPVRAAVSDQAWLASLLAAEAGLARAQAGCGLIPATSADAIARACTPERYDQAALAAGAAAAGNPVLPLVQAIRTQVAPAHADYVHFGATSQDVLDTAAMLVAAGALDALLGDLAAVAEATATLAGHYRDTGMAGRTLLQHALPVTLGLKAAGWLTAVEEASAGLARIRHHRLAVQLGGAAGTLAAYGPAGEALVAAYATELALAAPVLPWHTDRTRVAELTGALATAAGAIGKIARDVTLLAQSEVGEAAEAVPGGSSAMPHKRNPVAAVSALAATAQAPGLAATLYTAMTHEHERAAGAWHAEWRPLRELLRCTGSAAAWLRECLAGLHIEESALRAHLAALASTAGIDETTTATHTGAAARLVDHALAARAGRRE